MAQRKLLLSIAFSFVFFTICNTAEGQGRTFGIFNNSGKCRDCRYNSYNAEYCCYNNIDRDCCRYTNSNSGGNIGGGGSNVGIGGGGNNKPGYCPNNGYYGRRKRRATLRRSSKRNYNSGYSNNNNYDSQHYGCRYDSDCPGSQKCCSSGYSKICTYPTGNYYG